MKVLEEGKWGEVWSQEVVCKESSCGAKLLVEEKDLKPVDYRHDYYCECLVCGHQLLFQKKDIPLRLSKELDKKRKMYSSSGDWD